MERISSMARDAPSDIQRQIACARSVDHYYMYRIYFMTGQKRNQEAEQTEKWNYYHFISYEFNEAHCWRAHRLFFFFILQYISNNNDDNNGNENIAYVNKIMIQWRKQQFF